MGHRLFGVYHQYPKTLNCSSRTSTSAVQPRSLRIAKNVNQVI